MGRPKGPKKKDLTVSLTMPVTEWLDSKLESGEIANKSFFINKVLAEEMERERERAKKER
jgi:Arc/MetJ-type ribon-helix-helix transcriptional regulator